MLSRRQIDVKAGVGVLGALVEDVTIDGGPQLMLRWAQMNLEPFSARDIGHADAAIACRQVGPITLKGDLKDGEDVFKESRSWLFKKLQVVRFYDKPNNTLVYLSYSDKVVEGSPKNSISTVPIMPWGR